MLQSWSKLSLTTRRVNASPGTSNCGVDDLVYPFQVLELKLPAGHSTPYSSFISQPFVPVEAVPYLPGLRQQKEAVKKISVFFQHYTAMVNELDPILKKIAREKTVTIMCLNAGKSLSDP